MSKGNRTGPLGEGPQTGRRMGWRSGSGSRIRGGRGRNMGGAYGPGGYCICAKCGEKIPHRAGVKCTTLKCPSCGHTMIREELLENKRLKNEE